MESIHINLNQTIILLKSRRLEPFLPSIVPQLFLILDSDEDVSRNILVLLQNMQVNAGSYRPRVENQIPKVIMWTLCKGQLHFGRFHLVNNIKVKALFLKHACLT
jgi:hypothetical protein